MKETDAMTPEVSNGLSHEVTELDNPVLEKAAVAAPHLSIVESEPNSSEPEVVEDDWETVEFPEAVIPVDALPKAESIDIVTSLEQQNQTLRDRVAYLEKTLETAQTNLCQEVARWETLALEGDEKLQEQTRTQEQTIAKYVEELTETQKKVGELFAQLELSHQTAQRQQIVMETLNGQLRNSQERVAQLERECAGVHQTNVDQAQQVLQQNHQLKDLQARLQRQQRYTLQYKAALEKSLEVPQTAPQAAPALLAESTAKQLAAKQGAMPKPSPVQPWSAPTADAEAESQKAWLNSFMHESDTLPTESVITNFDWQPSEEQSDKDVSFDLDQLPPDDAIELQIEQIAEGQTNRLDAWETAIASPFITLQSSDSELDKDSDDSAECSGEPTGAKRESLAAVDLPMFSKDESNDEAAPAS